MGTAKHEMEKMEEQSEVAAQIAAREGWLTTCQDHSNEHLDTGTLDATHLDVVAGVLLTHSPQIVAAFGDKSTLVAAVAAVVGAAPGECPDCAHRQRMRSRMP